MQIAELTRRRNPLEVVNGPQLTLRPQLAADAISDGQGLGAMAAEFHVITLDAIEGEQVQRVVDEFLATALVSPLLDALPSPTLQALPWPSLLGWFGGARAHLFLIIDFKVSRPWRSAFSQLSRLRRINLVCG